MLDDAQFEPPQFLAPELAPLEPLVFNDDTPVLSDAPMDFAPPQELDETLDEVSTYSRPVGPTSKQRWAIASYVRALQLSRYVPANELAEADRRRLPEVPR